MAGARSRAAGFTLLELLVVVFIIGIMATMFTLSVGVAGGSDRELRREAERLQTLLGLALEDASFQARELGIHLYPKRYEFSVYDYGDLLVDVSDDQWNLIEDDVFAPHKLPDVFAFELEIEGKVVDLERVEREKERAKEKAEKKTVATEDDKNIYKPQLFIWSSGEFSDGFLIRIRSTEENRSYSLNVGVDGEVTLSKDDG